MKAVDLFAGWGGFTEGAERVGVEVVWAANHWPLAVEAHRANHPRATVPPDQLAFAFPDHDDGWEYRRGMPDRSGLAAYTHLIRWHGDPKETKARGQEARDTGERLPGASKRAGGDVASAPGMIRELLGDGVPRTFNCIALQLTGYTADALTGSPVEAALWSLCEDGALAWACEEGAVFWTLSRFIEWNDEGRAAA